MTTIGPQTHVEGRIEGDEDVTVEGRVLGTIALTESLTVAQGGFVDGDIEARTAVIEGAVEGTIHASELLHLTSTARVTANISAPTIRMDDGAQLAGEVDMDLDAPPPARTTSSTKTSTTPATSSKTQSTATAASKAPPTSEGPASEGPTSEGEKTRKVQGGSNAVVTETTTVTVEGEPEEDLDELTVKDLRDMLRDKDLPVSGTKAELIERLEEADD